MNNITSAEIYSSELDRVFEAKSATAFLADSLKASTTMTATAALKTAPLPYRTPPTL